MFGHQDNKQHDDYAGNDANQPAEAHGQADVSPPGPAETFTSGDHPSDDMSSDSNQADGSSNGSDWQHPGTPVDNPAPISDVVPPAGGFSKPADGMTADSPSDDHEHDNVNGEDNELVSIKHQAVEELSPLLYKLDQPAEERFRTLMMMVQSTDNQSLLPKAHEAAKQIEDEEARAQALLDVINEVNYFTHPQNGNNDN